MVEINLIPDVKRELLKAQALKNFIIAVSVIVSIACVAIVVLICGTVFIAQPIMMDLKDREIKSTFTTLESEPNAVSTVTLQNQLNQINTIHDSAPVTSRIMGPILTAIQPGGDNTVKYSNVNYTPATNTLTIEGQASGFPALETFKKTILETKIVFRDTTKENDCKASDVNDQESGCKTEMLTTQDVTTIEQAFGDNENGLKVLRFKVRVILNKKTLQTTSKGFAVLPPGKKDVTDSKTQIPDDMFKERPKDIEEEIQ